jgi:hypothetical protein
MSPIKLIERGLSTGNWQDVSDGYAGLTGTVISPPKGNSGNYNLRELLEQALSKLDGDTPKIEEEDTPPPVVNKKTRKPRESKVVATPKTTTNSKMKFYGGEDVPYTEEEKAWASKYNKPKPPREPRESKSSTFVCGKCGQEKSYTQISTTKLGNQASESEQLCVKCDPKAAR